MSASTSLVDSRALTRSLMRALLLQQGPRVRLERLPVAGGSYFELGEGVVGEIADVEGGHATNLVALLA
jgi:hypothetical protein